MQPLLIGDYKVGVQQDLKPFMIPEEAFPDMLNAFVFRGRVEKKAGYQLLGRLQRTFTSISIADVTLGFISSATTTYNLKTRLGITEATASIASGFVITIGAPDSQTLTDVGTGTLVISPVDATKITSATINYTTGILTLVWGGVVGNSSATFTGGYFPGLPAMGIRTREIPTQVNDEQTIFFDTKYAYQYVNGFVELNSTLPTTWSGPDSQQFWTTNFQSDATGHDLFWATNDQPGLQAYTITAATKAANMVVTTTNPAPIIQAGDTIYIYNADNPEFNFATGVVTLVAGNVITTNFNSAGFTGAAATSGLIVTPNRNISGDGIRYYNGSTWTNFNPLTNGVNAVVGALLIVPYKGRLLLLNTQEGNDPSLAAVTNNRQRVRWSQNGPVTDVVNGWRDDIVGRGGFEDAATNESIISCGFVKDELIVYFERSTWKLVYTGNEIGPFIWQRINSELGAESTFSAVQFDNGLVAFGNVGVHTSNGSSTARIDAAIPDEVFNAHNNVDGPLRTSGIRDFFQEVIYFAYANQFQNTPSPTNKTFFPNKMMIYNYRNNTFSFFDDNATCFGYFQRIADTPWKDLTSPFTWAAWNTPWNSGVLKAQFPNVAFGNQQGFIEVIEPYFTSNAASLWIKNIVGNTVTCVQHNLFDEQYITIRQCAGVTGVNDQTFQIQVIDQDTFTIDGSATGTYLGNGTIEVLSEIKVLTKQFTPYWTKGKRYDLKYMDVLFDRTGQGQVAVDVFVDFTDTNSMTATNTGIVLGNPILSTAAEGVTLPFYSFQQQGPQIWKRFYTVAQGETFQVQFTFNDSQMRTVQQVNADVVIHAMIFYFEEIGEFY